MPWPAGSCPDLASSCPHAAGAGPGLVPGPRVSASASTMAAADAIADAAAQASFFANIAVEPFIGPPQAGSRRAAPQQSRVESHPGRGARGGKACPSGQSSPYVPATVPPTRAPPTTWVALARSTDSIPNRMPVSMPGTEEQGATTAASLFGVFKEAVSDDDSGFIDL